MINKDQLFMGSSPMRVMKMVIESFKDDIGIDESIDPLNYPSDYGEGDGFCHGWHKINGNDKYDVGEIISDESLPGYKWAGSEPNFGLRDVSESDQLGLTSFHAATYTDALPNVPKNTTLMWEWLSSETINPNQELLQIASDNVFNFGTGPLSLERGESQRFSMVILFGDNLNDLTLNVNIHTDLRGIIGLLNHLLNRL
jgi:hypothetical protein